MDESSRDIVAHAHGDWCKKEVWKFMVWLILLDEVEIVLVVFDIIFDGKSVALGAVEGAIW